MKWQHCDNNYNNPVCCSMRALFINGIAPHQASAEHCTSSAPACHPPLEIWHSGHNKGGWVGAKSCSTTTPKQRAAFQCFAAEHRFSVQHSAKTNASDPTLCAAACAPFLSMALPHTRPVLSTAPAQHQPGIHPYCQVGPMTWNGAFLGQLEHVPHIDAATIFHFESVWHAPMAKGICPRVPLACNVAADQTLKIRLGRILTIRL